MEPTRFHLVARTGHPSFLDLPWDTPLEAWETPRLVNVIRGISRHVVRFVEYDGALYALKELPERPARREWSLLRGLESAGLPVVEAAGIVTNREHDLDAHEEPHRPEDHPAHLVEGAEARGRPVREHQHQADG